MDGEYPYEALSRFYMGVVVESTVNSACCFSEAFRNMAGDPFGISVSREPDYHQIVTCVAP